MMWGMRGERNDDEEIGLEICQGWAHTLQFDPPQ